jgi:sulfur relay (sulfurtransferase) DsrC/TusE family protein
MVKKTIWKNTVESKTFIFSTSETQCFTFQNDDFAKLRVDQKEFLYKGEMYDIKLIHTLGDSTNVIAYHDKVEKEILTFIKNIWNNFEDDDTIPSLIKKINSLVYIVPESPHLLVFFRLQTKEDHFSNHFPILKREISTNLQPPKIVF